MLVSGRASRLNDENVVPSNVFLDFYVRLTIGKRTDGGAAQRHPHVFANTLRQVAIRRAAENFQFRLEREHGAANLGVSQRPWQSSKLANQLFCSEVQLTPNFLK